jgi:secreted Zn-dependent insulinase-like peptidase
LINDYVDELDAEEVQKLTADELREFFDRHIYNRKTRAKISIQRYAHKWKEEYEKMTYDDVILIRDIHQFKHEMGLWPNVNSALKPIPKL